MAENTFHFGKHKGKPLKDVPEDYLEWVVLNHGDQRAIKTAQSELDTRGSKLTSGSKDDSQPKPAVASQLFTPDQIEIAVPKGKHKGKLLSELEDTTIHGLWSSWNGIAKLKADPFFAHIVAEKVRRTAQPRKQSTGAKKTPAKPTKVTATGADNHYLWTDPRGVTHLILNDVSMDGREHEVAPF